MSSIAWSTKVCTVAHGWLHDDVEGEVEVNSNHVGNWDMWEY
jgi:hypothetical protein